MAAPSRVRRAIAKKKAQQAQEALRERLIANAEKRLPKKARELYLKEKEKGGRD